MASVGEEATDSVSVDDDDVAQQQQPRKHSHPDDSCHDNNSSDESPPKTKKRKKKLSGEQQQSKNALQSLNELMPGLEYKCVCQTGPVHRPTFTVQVVVNDEVHSSAMYKHEVLSLIPVHYSLICMFQHTVG